MAYRLLREFRQASTRLDTPPHSPRHHLISRIARCLVGIEACATARHWASELMVASGRRSSWRMCGPFVPIWFLPVGSTQSILQAQAASRVEPVLEHVGLSSQL